MTIEATIGATLMAPAALPFETGNALTAMHKRGPIEETLLAEAWAATQRIPVRLLDVEIEVALADAISRKGTGHSTRGLAMKM